MSSGYQISQRGSVAREQMRLFVSDGSPQLVADTLESGDLRSGKRHRLAVIVVGTSTMREIDVQTHLCLADIAESIGFDLVGIAERALDRNKRMMPARFGGRKDSLIEKRMHEEYVIGLYKPPRHE